jgi:rhodanese-related sulfurtransferase
VAAATLKIDGMFFVLGGLLGVWLFGESVSSFEAFFLASSMGRFTLPEWLGLTTGVVVLMITGMALAMFAGGELLERRFGDETLPRTSRQLKRAGAALLLAGGLVLLVRGEPSAAERWRWTPAEAHRQLDDRAIFISPQEVVLLRKDTSVQVNVLDLRDEHDFNLFHIGGARRVSSRDLDQPQFVKALLDQPRSTVTFLVGNGEAVARTAWQGLKGYGVQNLYVIEGGINQWLDLYPVPACVAERSVASVADSPSFRFNYATGSSLPAAWPELSRSKEFRSPCALESTANEAGEGHGVVWPEHPFTRRVKLQVRSVVKGGCG